MKQLASENKIDLVNFEQEMTILYQLPAHPNIVRCLYFPLPSSFSFPFSSFSLPSFFFPPFLPLLLPLLFTCPCPLSLHSTLLSFSSTISLSISPSILLSTLTLSDLFYCLYIYIYLSIYLSISIYLFIYSCMVANLNENQDLFHCTLNGKLCLFMTRHSHTLQNIIHRKRDLKQPFSQPELCSVAYKIISGIEFLHTQQILHRDIKVCFLPPPFSILPPSPSLFPSLPPSASTNHPSFFSSSGFSFSFLLSGQSF